MKKTNQRQIPFRLNKLTRHIHRALLLQTSLLLFQPTVALATPEGGQIVGGSGQISNPNITTTLIQQNSNNMVIEWQSFNVGKNELVRFEQPSSSSAVLNRIFDQNPSQIFGRINANGHVFLSNPNGIIFGRSATVNVGSLIATGLDMNAAQFMRNEYVMSLADGETAGWVINQGIMSAATGGAIILVGGVVANQGKILADVGYVVLASGRKAVVNFDGNGAIRFQVDEAVLKNDSAAHAAVENSGEIIAEGGTVILSGQTAQDVFSQVVNNSGIVRAGRIDDSGGVIRLTGIGGLVANSGRLDASGSQGGDITLSGEQIEHSGTAIADGSEGDGGNITLKSSTTTTLSGNSRVTAQSHANGKGGHIKILGDDVHLLDNSVIDASGDSGGGEVLVGGDYQGSNPTILNATHTRIAASSTIKSDAITEGDGGKIIVWADEDTHFHGHASARGGAESGDGGFVEISGKQQLELAGIADHIDVSASVGDDGTILLDPNAINLVTTTQSDPGLPTYNNSTGFAVDIEIADVVTALDSANIILSTSDSGAGDDINVLGTISWSSANTLTLNADDNLNASAGSLIYSTGGGSWSYSVGGTASINVDVTGASASNRVYNGTTSATISGATLRGLAAGDDLSFNDATSGTFADKNVGTGKSVTTTLTIQGTDSGSYTLIQPTSITADITALALLESGVAVDATRIYDGTTVAANAAVSFSNIVAGDLVSTTVNSATYADKNVGNGKTVTVNYQGTAGLLGADAGNYTLVAASDTTTANITPKTLDVTGMTAANRVYDGTTAAAIDTSGAASAGIVGGDDVTFGSASGSFADKNVGTSKTTSITSLTLGGTDGANYLYDGSATTTADITALALLESGVAVDATRIYDGTTVAANAAVSFSNIVAGDSVSTTVSSATYADKNVGNGKTVTVNYQGTTGLVGADAGNYSLVAASNTTTADITALALLESGVAVDATRIYDGTTVAANAAVSFSNIVAGDSVSTTVSSATYADKNVGNGKTVTVNYQGTTGLVGTDAGNYTLVAASDTTTADITPLALLESGVAVDATRIYDGTTVAANAAVSFSNIMAGDSVSTTVTSATYADKNAANGKIVTVNYQGTAGLLGADAGNYTLVAASDTTTADITPLALIKSGVTVDATKVYDGNTNGINTAVHFSNIIAGDEVNATVISSAYSDKNVGTDKTVIVDYQGTTGLLGADAGNYTLTAGTDSTTADITQLSSVTWTGSGNATHWSDAANWAGSAIPDLSNVANVDLNNAQVIFDALPDPVQLTSISSALGLTIESGTLQVASSLVTAQLIQSGGTLIASDLTVSDHFNQTAGTIEISGTVDITETLASDLVLGDLTTTGSLSLTHTGTTGQIIQTVGTTLDVGGAFNLNANSHNALLGSANDFEDTITVTSGNNVTLRGRNTLSLGVISIAGDLDVEAQGGGLEVAGAINSTLGDIRLVAQEGLSQSANIAANSGSVKVFADSGSLTMSSGTKTTADNEIVYTGADNVTISQLNSSSSNISVTSENGNVLATQESVNISGTARANIYALGNTGSIGIFSTPLLFNNSLNSINLGLNQSAYIGAAGGQSLTVPKNIVTGNLSYETSSGIASKFAFGGSLTDVTAIQRELAGQVQASSDQQVIDIDSALLKTEITIFNVVGDGTLLPEDQLEDEDDDEELSLLQVPSQLPSS